MEFDGRGDGVACLEWVYYRGYRMSNIDRISSNPVSSVQKVGTTPVQRQVPADAPKQVPVTDKLELSGMSHLLQTLKKNDVRADKVAEVKGQIQAGKYEDEKKLDAAIDRLLDDLMK